MNASRWSGPSASNADLSRMNTLYEEGCAVCAPTRKLAELSAVRLRSGAPGRRAALVHVVPRRHRRRARTGKTTRHPAIRGEASDAAPCSCATARVAYDAAVRRENEEASRRGAPRRSARWWARCGRLRRGGGAETRRRRRVSRESPARLRLVPGWTAGKAGPRPGAASRKPRSGRWRLDPPAETPGARALPGASDTARSPRARAASHPGIREARPRRPWARRTSRTCARRLGV